MAADEERLRALFTTFDADGSGTLDAEELLEILTRGTTGLSLEDAKEIVTDFDDNKDGVLSVDEFVKAMAAVGGTPAAPGPPKVGDFILVTSGYYEGRVGKVHRIAIDYNPVDLHEIEECEYKGSLEGTLSKFFFVESGEVGHDIEPIADDQKFNIWNEETQEQDELDAAQAAQLRAKLRACATGKPKLYNVIFTDLKGGAAVIGEGLTRISHEDAFKGADDFEGGYDDEDEEETKAFIAQQYKARLYGYVEGKVVSIDKATMEARLTAGRARWAAKRAAQDAAQEAAMQKEWEKRGKAGRVPRVGEDRTSPVHSMWWELPWFDQWVSEGCDHQVLGISLEGIQQLLEHECFGGRAFSRQDFPALDWVTQAFGGQGETGYIGYDLGQVVRDFDVVCARTHTTPAKRAHAHPRGA